MRYRATLAYDGTAYQGFQRQAGETPTVQLALERAIAAVTGQQVTVIGAGRTDTGVHARGQVIAFEVEWPHRDDALMRALNVRLPGDIALQDIAPAPGFHPRFDAISRVYQYDILRSAQRQPLLRDRAWHVYGPLDEALMREAAGLLIGRHDFATFGQAPWSDNTVRTVMRSEWRSELADERAPLMVYTIEADAFLQHMVRRIVGLLVAVGRGRMTVATFEDLFRRAKLAEAVSLAPPQGLVLERVNYPPLSTGEGN
jgi:tRNA pseudouridine38-40 synthase